MGSCIPEGFKELKNVTEVFISDSEIVICGIPESEDENHNCDMMGCSSVSHVLLRAGFPRTLVGITL
jgi:hypothetical protein